MCALLSGNMFVYFFINGESLWFLLSDAAMYLMGVYVTMSHKAPAQEQTISKDGVQYYALKVEGN